MAEALYRKYRPSTFNDIVGQDHIKRTLRNAIEKNKVSHAYLFCGPRGTGKTTTARILAKALLCQNGPTPNPDGTCAECEAIAKGVHPDVYELDAASRTGVENVREEIISRVNYAPTRGQVKIYIIDEVHMLSVAAFNALLKTLEEPPSHVVFILCTTDPHKVPETIHSRCQRFDFHRISPDEIVERLEFVCKTELVLYEPEALDLIAHRSDGGMRNALTSLEQLIAFGEGKATYAGAQSLLGVLDDTNLHEIVMAIGRRDVPTCFSWTARFVEEGSDLAQFAQDLAIRTRDLYVMSTVKNPSNFEFEKVDAAVLKEELALFTTDRLNRMLGVLDDLIKELRLSSNARLSFEIALARLARPNADLTLESLAERIADLESQLARVMSQGISVVQTDFTQQPVKSVASASAEKPTTKEMTSGASNRNAVSIPSQPSRQVNAPSDSPENKSAASVTSPADSRVNGSDTVSVPESVHAPAPVQVSASASLNTPTTGVNSSSLSEVDVHNPAALQRLWRTTTAALRKSDPTCGVLFMNARVFPNASEPGILVEFAAESEFAFTAASREKSQTLLASTLDECARGHIPFKLVLAGGKGVAQQSQPVSVSKMQTSGGANSQAKAAQVPAQSQAQTQTKPIIDQGRQVASSMLQAYVKQQENVPSYYEDSVPLDIYDSYDETDYDNHGYNEPYGGVKQTSSAKTMSGSSQGVQYSQVGAAFTDERADRSRTAQSALSNERVQAPQAFRPTASSGGPAAQPSQVQSQNVGDSQRSVSKAKTAQSISDIEDMLSAGFGEGIKFEEL